MKLNNHISQTTNLTQEALIERILLKLKQEKYRVISVTLSNVTFDARYGGLIGNWEYINRLDSGTLEVVTNNYNVINLEYCSIPLSEYLWVFFLVGCGIVLSIVNSTAIPCFITLIFLALLIYKYFNLKGIAKQMLVEITTPYEK
jgi:hypothetical protein